MRPFGWGVDGLGRQHICRTNEVIVLLCVIPGCSVWDCIDLLQKHQVMPTEKRTEVMFYQCVRCKNKINAKDYESYDQVKAGYPARCKCSPLTDYSRWEKIYKQYKVGG